MRIAAAALLWIGFLLFPAMAAGPGYDIIIAAGQSNMAGVGRGPYRYSAPDLPGRILQIGQGDMLIGPARHDRLRHGGPSDSDLAGPALNFARLYAQRYLAPGRSIVIVPAAWGGTAIDCFMPDGACWHDMIARVDRAVAEPGDNRVVAFLWQHMETNIQLYRDGDPTAIPPAAYQAELEGIIGRLRRRYGDGMAVIVGEPLRSWLPGDRVKAQFVRAAERAVANVGRAGFVGSAGLKSNLDDGTGPDGIHFSGRSQMRLGERYFMTYDCHPGR